MPRSLQCVRASICMCIYQCVRASICMCIYVFFVCVCVNGCEHMHVLVYARACVCTCNVYSIHVRLCTCARLFVHASSSFQACSNRAECVPPSLLCADQHVYVCVYVYMRMQTCYMCVSVYLYVHAHALH